MKAREAMLAHKLPKRSPAQRWGGPGVGASCPVCGEAILRDAIEIQLEFAPDGAHPGSDDYHLHPACAAAWELERCQNFELSVDTVSTDPAVMSASRNLANGPAACSCNLPAAISDGTMAHRERDGTHTPRSG
jgi:hypothetical protein